MCLMPNCHFIGLKCLKIFPAKRYCSLLQTSIPIRYKQRYTNSYIMALRRSARNKNILEEVTALPDLAENGSKAKKTAKKPIKSKVENGSADEKPAKQIAQNDDNQEPPQKKSKTKDKVSSQKSKTTASIEPKIDETEVEETESADNHNIYAFSAKDIRGNDVFLGDYKRHVCIIVNVASRCGHTKANYEQLVQLHEEYSKSKGLKILAFPCNQFGKQEPGDAQKICEFVEKRNVKFDMFDKIDVNGKNAHPLWIFMQNKIAGPKGNKIDWNFTKFIIDKEGNVVERHKPSVKPLQMVESLEKYW